MVFKKPYAFFIKYFRLINLFLVLLFCYLSYNLNLIRQVINDVYMGSLTNFSSLNSTYIGFKMYLLIFLIMFIVGSIIVLLKKKKKPFNDYLFSIIYTVIILAYLLFISNVFLTLEETIIEQTTLKLYTDISLLVIFPLLYFIFKFILIVIGFNISKFNFSQDIMELKQEEQDNEEVEVSFDKNTYKYRRNIRRTLREFKYYYLENKFIINVILGIIIVIISLTFFSLNMFNSNKVKINESFVAGGFGYNITKIYETKYDLNHNEISNDSKFIIVNVEVRNRNTISTSIDLKRIRLVYENEYVYANNYYNKYFYDLGKPYNKESLNNKDLYNYTFIFKVPNSYKKNNYVLKFYDRVLYENEEVKGSYKELKVNSDNLDRKIDEKKFQLKENTIFNKKSYGNSNLTLLSYDIKNSYIYNDGNNTQVIRDKDINKMLLILDYKLSLDNKSLISYYFNSDVEFFDKFTSISYIYNGKEKNYDNIRAINAINGKVMLSIPYEVQNATNLNIIFNFRNVKIIYKLK